MPSGAAATPAVFTAELIEQKEVAAGHFEMRFAPHAALVGSDPGAFVQVSCRASGWDPLLRRPFSLYWVDRTGFGLLYRVVGRGTAALAQLRPPARLSIVGPLGRGFRREPGSIRPALVGGGVGVPPLYFLARALVAEGRVPRVYLGFTGKEFAFGIDRFEALGCTVTVTTDDGCLGEQGWVTAPLARDLAAGRIDALYACGPHAMLAAVATLTERHGVPGQVALEAWMGCGVGACLSCVHPVRDEAGVQLRRVCVDGPVFSAGKVVFSDG